MALVARLGEPNVICLAQGQAARMCCGDPLPGPPRPPSPNVGACLGKWGAGAQSGRAEVWVGPSPRGLLVYALRPMGDPEGLWREWAPGWPRLRTEGAAGPGTTRVWTAGPLPWRHVSLLVSLVTFSRFTGRTQRRSVWRPERALDAVYVARAASGHSGLVAGEVLGCPGRRGGGGWRPGRPLPAGHVLSPGCA